MAQWDALPTGDEEFVGSIPAGLGNILSWRLIMKYFLQSFTRLTSLSRVDKSSTECINNLNRMHQLYNDYLYLGLARDGQDEFSTNPEYMVFRSH